MSDGTQQPQSTDNTSCGCLGLGCAWTVLALGSLGFLVEQFPNISDWVVGALIFVWVVPVAVLNRLYPGVIHSLIHDNNSTQSAHQIPEENETPEEKSGENSTSKKPRREPIPKSVKMYVWQRDQGKCVECGSKELLEYDHIIPISKGGSNTDRNLQLLCQNCNRSKGSSIG